MSRAKRIYSDQYPYHITARCINKAWFELPMKIVWEIFSNHLYFCHHGFNARIHSFVLMNNHFHLMVSTPSGNISEIMRYLMTETSREITQLSGRINQTYGGPYFSSLITKDLHYKHVYKYIYRNPVEAGISQTPESYPYSSLTILLGQRRSIIPLLADEILMSSPEESLRWINKSYEEGVRDDIKFALRRGNFKFPRCSKTKRQNRLETSIS